MMLEEHMLVQFNNGTGNTHSASRASNTKLALENLQKWWRSQILSLGRYINHDGLKITKHIYTSDNVASI